MALTKTSYDTPATVESGVVSRVASIRYAANNGAKILRTEE